MSDISPTPPSSASSESSDSGKLGFLEKFGFGVGDLASNLLFQTFNMFLLFFYTDVVGLSAGSVFWIFLVAKIWDMVNDPMMGAIADRTHSRWGRYRPYIFALAIPYGISAFLLFTVPDISDTAKVFYCGATYIFATMMYTGVNIPYCALMGVITPDIQERTSVSQYRFFMAFAGGWLINTFTLPLVRLFGDDKTSPTFNEEVGYDPVSGYPTAMIVFGTLAVLLFFMTFFTTKERVAPVTKVKSPFSQDVKDLVGNFPWLILFISAVLNLANVAVRNGAMLYFLNYYVVDSARSLFSVNFGFFELEVTRTVLFMSIGALATMIGVLPTQYLVKRFEKRTLYIIFMVTQGLSYIAIYFVPGENYSLILTLHIVGMFLAGPGPVIVFSMYADVADYSEWKTNRRATGLIIATILFAIKGGLWIGAQFNSLVLWIVDYSKDTAAATPEVVHAISLLFTWAPGILAAVAGLILLKYTVSDSMMRKIEIDLQERKAAAEG
ncbi:sugar (Glycoside-Pentoside-Hexuronide) transporter subfamily [Verrucomicrobiia bacterium DG1235]|nr:sugar (Glycoside-Pentoside-Hexuronide) transporter subfamily [Verrucomicrobiae bacterium DG1235]